MKEFSFEWLRNVSRTFGCHGRKQSTALTADGDFARSCNASSWHHFACVVEFDRYGDGHRVGRTGSPVIVTTYFLAPGFLNESGGVVLAQKSRFPKNL
jgi:hypothetical protein